MAIANTVSLQTDLNVDPYYDDFNETKNFYRILFRPGLAVQARELTQLQTILQNQVDRFAEHMFKEGSIIRGVDINYDHLLRYVKLKDGYGPTVVGDFVNKIVEGTSGVQMQVLYANTGSVAETPNLATIYGKYIRGGTANTEVSEFSANEKLQVVGDASANACVAEGAETPIGFGSLLTTSEGILFTRDHFVRVSNSAVIVSKYHSNTASARLGFEITESIVDSGSDNTLLDPAQGAYNYTAPGANRLKISGELKATDLANTDVRFIEIAKVDQGALISKAEKTSYNQIRDYFAQRTHDESGDYCVRGHTLKLQEHAKVGSNKGLHDPNETRAGYLVGNTDLLMVSLNPGKSYVQGYDITTISQKFKNIQKGTDTEQVEDLTVPAQYGNYILVTEVVGDFNFDAQPVVSLRDTTANAVANSEWSVTSAVGAEIGTARIKSIQHHSGVMGSPQCQYKLYLYDIQMSGTPFTSARSVYLNNTSTADAKADFVLTGGNAVLLETDFNRSVYSIPASNIKTIRDSTNSYDTLFKFHKDFDVTLSTGGTTTLTTTDSTEQFPFSTGVLSDSQAQGAFYLTLNADANTAVLSGTVSMSSGGNTVTGTATSFDTQFNVGDVINVGNVGSRIVSAVNSATDLRILGTAGSTVTGVQYFKEFKLGQVLDLGGVGSQGANREVNITTTTTATLDVQETFTGTVSATVHTELNKVDGQEISKVRKAGRYVRINCATHSATVNGPWGLGFSDVWRINSVRKDTSAFTSATQGTDVTAHFELDTGQTDNLYKHGKLKKKTTSNLTIGASDYLLVDVDYFTHDTSAGVGYFSVDSYPIDDVNGSTANTNAITTQEIPFYISPVDNKLFKLRDSFDFRGRITDTATDTTTVSSGTTNPATSTTIVEPSGGLHFPPPNEDMNADVQYYLKRVDVISLAPDGTLESVKGIPSLFPVTPETPAGSMKLGKINIAPYPSLTADGARTYDRPEMACAIVPENNIRYTMKDIGAIRQRVDNLEYYSSLNLLEKATKDLNIQDGSGNDRFKNGMLVDPFNGHGIGNVYNNDYAVSVDKQNKEARPKFRLENVELEYNSTDSTNIYRAAKDATITVLGSGTYTNGESITAGAASGTLRYQVGDTLHIEETSGTFIPGATLAGASSGTSREVGTVTLPKDGDLAMLPYKHSVVIDQDVASSTRACAGLLWNWAGNVTLTPDNDYWTDTTTRPDVNINFDLNTDNWIAMANSWETDWNDWQTLSVGVQEIGSRQVSMGTSAGGPGSAIVETIGREATLETTTRQSRQGVRNEVIPETRQDRLGTRVVDMSLQPYMRSRTIRFLGQALKPQTRLHAFFDGINVNEYVTPANSSYGNTGVQGANLESGTDGTVYGYFTIPNNSTLQFNTGTKIFRLTDSENNSKVQGKQVTSAEAPYAASGISQVTEETVLSTRFPRFTSNRVEESRSIVSRSTSTTRTGSRVVGFVPVPTPPGDIAFDGGDDSDGADSSCFVKGTLVRLADGSDKKIEEIEIGDVLLGMDGSENKVLEFDHPMLDGRDLVGINGSGPLMTPEHPLMTKDGWKAYNVDDTLRAYPHLHEIMEGNLAAGDKILDVDGNWVMIESMELYEGEEDQQVYNFILDGNNTYHANGFLAHNRDPVAQSFTIDASRMDRMNTDGMFITKCDLFFSSKDPTYGALIEIREMTENGETPTNSVIPFGHVNITADQIVTSADGSVATPCVFPSPVFLKNNVEYCIVITPHGFNPNLRIWVARIGEKDILTGKSITKNIFAGTLFASANDKTYTAIQEEDYKFKLYAADFSAETSGSLRLNNVNQEFLTIANQSGGTFDSVGVMAYGATTLNLGGSVSVNTATEYANGGTSAAKGVVEYHSGSTVRVIHQGPSSNTFQAAETVKFYYIANGSWTGVSSTISSITQPKGKIYKYDNTNASNTFLFLANTSGQFYAEQTLTLQGDQANANARARIVSIDNLRTDVHLPQMSTMTFPATAIEPSAKFAISGSTQDSAYRNTTLNENNSLNGSKYILSRSNEIANLSSNKSVDYRLQLSRKSGGLGMKRLSPVVDLSRTSVTSVKNLINNVDTNEDAANGGDALSRYISRTVTLAEGQDAEDLVVYINAYKPATADFSVYHKLVNAEDSDGIQDAVWVKMTQDTISTIVSDTTNTEDYKEYKYVIDPTYQTGGSSEYQYTNSQSTTFTGFKHFAIKIVFKSSTPHNPPRIKDFRAIALQM